MDRREFLGGSLAALIALRGPRARAVLTTDLQPGVGDPDDLYDVACAVALGFSGVVLDAVTPPGRQALRRAGAPELEPSDLMRADAIAVVGSATNAARYYRGQRVVLFGGDASVAPEPNERSDPEAFRFLLSKDAIWIPCFDGGAFQGSTRSSWTVTSDSYLLDGSAWSPWWRRYATPAPERSVYCGAYLGFAFRNRVAGAAIRPFRGDGRLAMATRALLRASAPDPAERDDR